MDNVNVKENETQVTAENTAEADAWLWRLRR